MTFNQHLEKNTQTQIVNQYYRRNRGKIQLAYVGKGPLGLLEMNKKTFLNIYCATQEIVKPFPAR